MKHYLTFDGKCPEVTKEEREIAVKAESRSDRGLHAQAAVAFVNNINMGRVPFDRERAADIKAAMDDVERNFA